MLGLLKSLFSRGGGGASARSVELEAKLRAVSGGAGYGEIEYTAWPNGDRVIEVELRNAQDGEAEVVINGVSIATLAIDRGLADFRLDTKNGRSLPEFRAGDRVEIRQAGATAFTGDFRRD